MTGPRPLLQSDTYSLGLQQVRLLPDDGTGVVVSGANINGFEVSLNMSGGTGFFLDDEFSGGMSVQQSRLIATGPTERLAIGNPSSSGNSATFTNTVIGGLWVALLDVTTISFRDSTVATPGAMGQSPCFPDHAVIGLASGECQSPRTTYSNLGSCVTESDELGIQTWNRLLDPAMWDFNHNLQSAPYLNGAGATLDDMTPTAAGLPTYWEGFHGVSCPAGNEDDDGDSLTCLQEYAQGTSPATPDTDSDGTTDDVDGAPLDPTAQ